MLRVLSVDLGATSIRVAAVDLDTSEIEIVHRYAHEPVRHEDGSLRWDWTRITEEVRLGLEAATTRGAVASIGVDAWGVDYGLIGDDDKLVAAPFCYRDARTAKWRATAERIGEQTLYATTGIQLMAINTIFQLVAHRRDELARARRLLMLPELMVHALTGHEWGERTSAGTTQLVDVATGDWSGGLLAAIDVPRSLLPDIANAATRAGEWSGIPVHLVGGHDTASAVAAVPGGVFISSGTWMLVGTECATADTSEGARAGNWSNEPGVCGGVRLLRNVMGLWMLEQCYAEWGTSSLLGAAEAVPRGPVVDATDERFLAPRSMVAEVTIAAGLPGDAPREVVVRCVLDSLAETCARVVAELADLTGEPVTRIHVVGGGARNAFLNRLIGQACGVPVAAGSTEATALGNALVQGIALGRYASLEEARSR